jgi:predicted TIM-barrel fold metal-dependent hydrolase
MSTSPASPTTAAPADASLGGLRGAALAGQLGFRAFDADNHYYEATDAFTRHMPKALAKRGFQWVTLKGKPRVLLGGKLFKFIPNPTFDPVAKPGSLDAFFRGRNPEGRSMVELFGDLEPIRPAYRDRDARLTLLDEQGLEGALLFPTMGVGVEQAVHRSAEVSCALLDAFNRWLDEDWGFAWHDRLFAVPMLSLTDVGRAAAMLEWTLVRGARMVHLRAAPVPGADRTRSPGDTLFDPFWARVSEAGIAVAFHAGDHGYGRYAAAWEQAGGPMEAFRGHAFGMVTQEGRAIYDTMAALVLHGVFQRFPNLRVCSVENGSDWVSPLLKKLDKAWGQYPHLFVEPPRETFRRHVWIAPYYEDDIAALAAEIGAGQVLMGSDFPHAEGLADPVSFVRDLRGLGAGDVRRVMRENALELLEPRPESAR